MRGKYGLRDTPDSLQGQAQSNVSPCRTRPAYIVIFKAIEIDKAVCSPGIIFQTTLEGSIII